MRQSLRKFSNTISNKFVNSFQSFQRDKEEVVVVTSIITSNEFNPITSGDCNYVLILLQCLRLDYFSQLSSDFVGV